MGNEVPTEPLLFLKPSSSLIPTGVPIMLPPFSTHVEFEGEIGLILGQRLRFASPEECLAAITSVVAINDVTARDLQRSDAQWTRAKGCDTFCPVGAPVPVNQIEGGLDSLTIRSWHNGELRQEGKVSDMVFSFGELLSYASRVMTLEGGDLILTGTPEGVAPLNPGDTIRIEIPGLSQVENMVEAGQ